MKSRSSGQSGAECSVAWQVQNGRSRVQRGLAADGFRGDYPYAGVTVVAENRNSEEDSSASITVETVRDVFAEGVAFGVEDALRDAFLEASELIRDKRLGGCSAAAIAYSGTHIWFALSGNCRIYLIDSDGVKCIVRDQTTASELNMSTSHPDYSKKVRQLKSWLGGEISAKPLCGHARVKKDTTYLLLTAGGWTQFDNIALSIQRKGIKTTLSGWLGSLIRDLKLAYRRQGGALAAVSGAKERMSSSISWKSIGLVFAFLALMGYLVFGDPFSCSAEVAEKTDLFSSDSVVTEIVQPLTVDSISSTDESESGLINLLTDSLIHAEDEAALPGPPDLTADLPLQIVQIGGITPSLNSDTFAVSHNSEPDIQWENYSPGIYAIESDTASFVLAEQIRSSYPNLDVILLDRIITVRETGVAESARWLSSLSPDSAALTGVIVETRSSVAGGADWIRNYPVFANGNRDERAGEAGGFSGDSLIGLPSLRTPRCYRLIVIP